MLQRVTNNRLLITIIVVIITTNIINTITAAMYHPHINTINIIISIINIIHEASILMI